MGGGFPAFTAFIVFADFPSYLLFLLRKHFFSSVISLVFGRAGSLLLRGLSLAVGVRAALELRRTGFLQQWFLLLQTTGSRARGLQQLQLLGSGARLNICSARA